MIGLICALPSERHTVEKILSDRHDESQHPFYKSRGDDNMYTFGRVGRNEIVVASLPAGDPGISPTTKVASNMRHTFGDEVKMVLLVGIAGGVPKSDHEPVDLRLGDVVVSKPGVDHPGVIQWDRGKITTGGWERIGSLNNPPRLLLNTLALLQSRVHGPEWRLTMEGQSSPTRPSAEDLLFPADYVHNNARGLSCERCQRKKAIKSRRHKSDIAPRVHLGLIASGNHVIKDGQERDRITTLIGPVLCFEMEAAGLMNELPCLVIRGISDYADSHKNDAWHTYATGTAAAFTKAILLELPDTAGTGSGIGRAVRADDQSWLSRLEDKYRFLKDASTRKGTNRPDYWDHMTERGLRMYEFIWLELPKTKGGNVSLEEFKLFVQGHWPQSRNVDRYWKRIDPQSPTHDLNKNHLLTVLYMLHIEYHFPGELPTDPEDGRRMFGPKRERDNECFGNWVKCECGPSQRDGKHCTLQWSYANGKWGIHRGAGETKCLAYRWLYADTDTRLSDRTGQEIIKKNHAMWRKTPPS